MLLYAINKVTRHLLSEKRLLEAIDTKLVGKGTELTAQAVLSADYELNGTINRAANEGAKFALILAMLEQDCTYRPQFQQSNELASEAKVEVDFSHYRSNPLSANDAYWHSCQHTSQLFHNRHFNSARLWLAMHPEPFSQENNALKIDDDIIRNCNVSTQERILQDSKPMLKVDETGLYDVLKEVRGHLSEVI